MRPQLGNELRPPLMLGPRGFLGRILAATRPRIGRQGYFQVFESTERMGGEFPLLGPAPDLQQFAQMSGDDPLHLFDSLWKIVGLSFGVLRCLAAAFEPQVGIS